MAGPFGCKDGVCLTALKRLIGADEVTAARLEGAGHGRAQFTAAANLKVVLDSLSGALKKRVKFRARGS